MQRKNRIYLWSCIEFVLPFSSSFQVIRCTRKCFDQKWMARLHTFKFLFDWFAFVFYFELKLLTRINVTHFHYEFNLLKAHIVWQQNTRSWEKRKGTIRRDFGPYFLLTFCFVCLIWEILYIFLLCKRRERRKGKNSVQRMTQCRAEVPVFLVWQICIVLWPHGLFN